MRSLHLFAIGAAAIGLAMAKPAWKPLFNGKTFGPEWYIAGDTTYWSIDPAEGAIVGESSTRTTPYTMVFTNKKDFDQFTIKYSYRLKAGCSGFFFRSKENSTTERVAGMQIEAKYLPTIGNSEVGSLYCHTCGDWEVQHSQSYSNKIRRPDDQYQDVVVTVKNPNIYVNVNGFQAVGETDAAEIAAGASRAYNYANVNVINTPGNLGLQIHGGQRPMDVRFKNIAILEGCTDQTKPGYDAAQFVTGLAKQPAVYQSNPSLCEVTEVEAAEKRAATWFGPILRQGREMNLQVAYQGAHSLEIVSLQGKVVFSASSPTAQTYHFTPPSQAGIYWAKIKSKEGVASRKIIVQ